MVPAEESNLSCILGAYSANCLPLQIDQQILKFDNKELLNLSNKFKRNPCLLLSPKSNPSLQQNSANIIAELCHNWLQFELVLYIMAKNSRIERTYLIYQ